MLGQTLILTLKLATITTLFLLVVCMPLARWLARTRSPLKPMIESIASLPLVLPPTVLGFYLLVAFSPENAFGHWLDETIGLRLVFSFEGLVAGSMIYSLPFMLHPLQNGFSAVPNSLIEAAQTMGKSSWQILRHVQLPNMKPALLTGLVLSFAHTIGEFGVVLMIGGNIPGETKVASMAIYEAAETRNFDTANAYSLILIGITLAILLLVYGINGGYLKRFWK